MNITEHISETRPTNADLAAFETFIQGSLPDDYKSFLKNENGGRPKPNRFRFTTKDGGKEESTVHYFFALHEGRVGNIQKHFERYKRRIVPGYIPLGTDPLGNLLILGVTGQSMRRVYFWDHEKEGDLPSVANMSLVANSFSEFIEQLF